MSLVTSVLVVDDNLDARKFVKRILENAEYTVLQASDGQDALEVLEQEHVDLIIADIAMPRMNGYQFFEKVTQNPEWVAVPFIFLSARTLDSDVRYAKLMGVDEYITKPVRAVDLLTAVRGRLQRASLVSNSKQVQQQTTQDDDGKLVYGALCINPNTYKVTFHDETMNLSVREFRLLKCLIENHGNVVELSELALATHEINAQARDAGNLIRPLVRSVRRKLGYDAGEWGCIWSVRGIGYRIVKTDV